MTVRRRSHNRTRAAAASGHTRYRLLGECLPSIVSRCGPFRVVHEKHKSMGWATYVPMLLGLFCALRLAPPITRPTLWSSHGLIAVCSWGGMLEYAFECANIFRFLAACWLIAVCCFEPVLVRPRACATPCTIVRVCVCDGGGAADVLDARMW